jgi:hypothetical protein
MNATNERFSVCQFFPDGDYEYYARELVAEEAVKTAKRLTETVGARIGTTRRVIITDDGDCCVFEWKYGEGVTFPTPEERRTAVNGAGSRNG